MKNETIIHQEIFAADFDYPVIFGRDLFNPANPTLVETLTRRQDNRRLRAIVFVDSGVAENWPDLSTRISSYFTRHHQSLELVCEIIVIPGGEEIKNDYRQCMHLADTLLEYNLCRQSFVIAIGGGAVLDMVGFATSLVHRGLRLVRFPTTVLAQNDAGVGVKNGMNLRGGKNTVGTFAPPFAVINDYDFLQTLSLCDWVAGISEAFKVGIIKDREFFDFLCANAEAFKRREIGPMEELIRRCAILHLDHIALNGDPFELGTARPLDFGHWAAHKLESLTNYEVSHGHAVAMGIALDSGYALRTGLIDDAAHEAILTGLSSSGFTLWHPALDRGANSKSADVLDGLEEFREHLGGELTITMPQGIGNKVEVHEMDMQILLEVLDDLKHRFASTGQAN
jgi:3-dehydroquinate synthase